MKTCVRGHVGSCICACVRACVFTNKGGISAQVGGCKVGGGGYRAEKRNETGALKKKRRMYSKATCKAIRCCCKTESVMCLQRRERLASPLGMSL